MTGALDLVSEFASAEVEGREIEHGSEGADSAEHGRAAEPLDRTA